MKNTLSLLVKTALVLITLILSGAIYAQKKETVTITGKITVKDTGKPPIGIITVLEKGVAEYLVFKKVIGTNHHTFIQKDGSFKFIINKGGAIVITDNKHRYLPIEIKNLDKSQNLNIILNRIPNYQKAGYPPNELHKLEPHLDVTKRIKVSGIIMDKSKNLLADAYVTQWSVFNEMGDLAFTTSKKNGEFSYKILKGDKLIIDKQGYETMEFSPKNDTVVNIILNRLNPFD